LAFKTDAVVFINTLKPWAMVRGPGSHIGGEPGFAGIGIPALDGSVAAQPDRAAGKGGITFVVEPGKVPGKVPGSFSNL
jgi:hypothetical protein